MLQHDPAADEAAAGPPSPTPVAAFCLSPVKSAAAAAGRGENGRISAPPALRWDPLVRGIFVRDRYKNVPSVIVINLSLSYFFNLKNLFSFST